MRSDGVIDFVRTGGCRIQFRAALQAPLPAVNFLGGLAETGSNRSTHLGTHP